MPNPLTRTAAALCLCAAFVLCVPVQAQQDQGTAAGGAAQGPKIKSITVEGNYLVSEGSLLRVLGVAEGAAFDQKALQERVDQINALGTVGQVSFEAKRPDGTNVDLRVRLVEKLKIHKLEFENNKEVGSAELRAIGQIEPGQIVEPHTVRAAQMRMAEHYGKSGFPLASVKAYARFIKDEGNVLVFDVVEGPQVWVERMEFEGNAKFDAGDLKDVMTTSERGWLPFIWPGKFDEAVFVEDLTKIEDKYYQSGSLDVIVGGYWTYAKDFRRIILHVLVYEGPTYKVKGIGFEGNTLFRNSELAEAVPLEPGDVFLPPKVEEAKKIISRLYGRQGYVDVSPDNKDTLHEELAFSQDAPELDVNFHIKEGKPVFIRRIRVEGLTKTSEVVVLRNLAFSPGDRVNTEKFEASERRLKGTGFFDLGEPEPVAISLSDPVNPDEPSLRDAIVKVKEGTTGLFMVGAGVNSESGVLGQISLSEKNFDISNTPSSWRDFLEGNAFRGAGQHMTLRLSMGSQYSSFLASFYDPSVNNTERTFGAELYSTRTAWEEFDLSRTGANVTFGKHIGQSVTREIELGWEFINMSNLADDAPPEIRRDEGSFQKPYVALILSKDKRDSETRPSEGHFARLRSELAFADIATAKVVGDVEKYWTAYVQKDGEKHIFSLRGRAGVMDSYSGHTPVFERFYAGGQDSLRGFQRWGVSPVEPVKHKQVGGESLVTGSAEYSIPIYKDSLRLGGFLDAGYVGESAADILSGWGDLRVAPGVGIRWLIPAMGGVPLSLDIAFPIMKDHEDETESIQFSFGASHAF
jgi:outer membrane protein insertion porin family